MCTQTYEMWAGGTVPLSLGSLSKLANRRSFVNFQDKARNVRVDRVEMWNLTFCSNWSTSHSTTVQQICGNHGLSDATFSEKWMTFLYMTESWNCDRIQRSNL